MPTEPGEYLLFGTVVQESFAWFHHVDPSLAGRGASQLLTGTGNGAGTA